MTTYTVINNADSGAGTLRSDLSLAQSGDTINFAPSVQLITLATPLEIKTNVTIEGSQPAALGTPGVVITGNSVTREFTIDSGVSTRIDGVDLSYGHDTGTRFNMFTLTSGTTAAGAIYDRGTLTLSNSLLDHNTGQGYDGYTPFLSGNGGGTPGGPAVGGIYVASGATLNLVGSTNAFAANTGIGGTGGTGANGGYDMAVKAYRMGGAGGRGAHATSGTTKTAANSGEAGYGPGYGMGGAPYHAGETASNPYGSSGGGGGGNAFADYGGPGTVNIVPVCFASGTLIRTVRGAIAVEALNVGDLAITASGALRPIRWLGHRTIDCGTRPRPRDVWPIRVAAHAFGDGLPSTDLFLSAGHAVQVGVMADVLIPIGKLINGATIACHPMDEVTYWHVELDSHDVLIANDLPAESFLDCGNRFALLEQQGDYDRLAGAHTPADYCRPLVEDGDVVEAARLLLAARAARLGWTTTHDMDMHLMVDGQRVEPDVDGAVARFFFPASATTVVLASSTRTPADVEPTNDVRRLGISLHRLDFDDGLRTNRAIIATDTRLAGLVHREDEVGHQHRFTDGHMVLPTTLWDGCRGQVALRVHHDPQGGMVWIAPAAAATAGALRAVE